MMKNIWIDGLFYGYDEIPKDWLSVIKRREWIEEMCKKADGWDLCREMAGKLS
ncbi:MAG: hypothetical protein K6G27_08840 [Lachnospiraceae bacterium]|nr:hypothetical protein [Lachnospiraceae bacterium]